MEFDCIIYKNFNSILIELLISFPYIFFTDSERTS